MWHCDKLTPTHHPTKDHWPLLPSHTGLTQCSGIDWSFFIAARNILDGNFVHRPIRSTGMDLDCVSRRTWQPAAILPISSCSYLVGFPAVQWTRCCLMTSPAFHVHKDPTVQLLALSADNVLSDNHCVHTFSLLVGVQYKCGGSTKAELNYLVTQRPCIEVTKGSHKKNGLFTVRLTVRV